MLSIATVLATFVAGLGSFLAPCTVPLLPAYLACVSGVSAAELSNPDRHSFRLRLLAGSLLYVAGFTLVFVLLGLTAGGIARVANGAVSGRIVEIVGGVAVILFGLAIIGVVRIGLLERTQGFQLPERLRRRGRARRLPGRRRLRARLDAVRRAVPGRGADPRRAQLPRTRPARCSWSSIRSGWACPSSRSRCSGRHSPTSPAASTGSCGP